MAAAELLFPRLVVFGSTGGTGSQVVQQALKKGYNVAAVVRSPEKLIDLKHENLEVAKGDVFDPESLVPILEGKNAVMSCLGFGLKPHYSKAIKSVITASERAGIARIVTSMTGIYTQKHPQNTRSLDWIFRPFVQRQSFMKDQMLAEDIIMKSNLCYTIVRLPTLSQGPLTDNYLVFDGQPPWGLPWTVSRADVAHFMLKSLQTKEWDNKGVEIARKK